MEKAKKLGMVDYETTLVLSTNPESACLADAAAKGYPTLVMDTNCLARNEINEMVESILEQTPFDLCFLCGFKFLLPPGVIRE